MGRMCVVVMMDAVVMVHVVMQRVVVPVVDVVAGNAESSALAELVGGAIDSAVAGGSQRGDLGLWPLVLLPWQMGVAAGL